MIWLENIYVGDSIAKKRDKIIKKIKKGKITMKKYVLALSRNDSDLLDVFQANVLKQKYYQEQNIIVVGLASGEEEAFELVKKIIDDCLEATGGYNLKQFFGIDEGETNSNA